MKKLFVSFILLVLVSMCFSQTIPDKILYFAEALCLEYGLNLKMCLAILMAENPTFNELASHENLNGTTDLGLWQLNSRYIDLFAVYWGKGNFDVLNWKCNTYSALNHIKMLCDNLETTDEVIKAYNCGIGAVMSGRIPQSTENYLLRVKRNIEELNQ